MKRTAPYGSSGCSILLLPALVKTRLRRVQYRSGLLGFAGQAWPRPTRLGPPKVISRKAADPDVRRALLSRTAMQSPEEHCRPVHSSEFTVRVNAHAW